MTVEELAEAAGMSTGNISALENHRQGHSTEGLEKLAHALKTTPDALLGVDPLSEGTGQFWPLWERASAKDRQFLIDMAGRLVSGAAAKK